MGTGAIIIGAILIITGIFMIIISNANVVALIYGGIFIAVGIALIFFWKEEGLIEQRKDLKPFKARR